MFKKFRRDRDFYKSVLVVAVPIMIQNGITNFVSLLDNLMVGQVGTLQMSGVSIINQLMFVFNLTVFGGLAGAGIFASQFFGKSDYDGVFKGNSSARLFCVIAASLHELFHAVCVCYRHRLFSKFRRRGVQRNRKGYVQIHIRKLINFRHYAAGGQ